MSTELSVQVKSKEEESALQEYKNLEELSQLPELISQGKSIIVDSPDQTDLISSARKIRLALKRLRTAIESKRKDLKEAIVLRGKAIDGMANIFKDMIVPVENHLNDQEKYAERLEAKRLNELAAAREAALAPYVQDLKCYDLKAMTEQGFNQLLQSSRMAFEAQREAERRAEEERIAKAKQEEEEHKAREKAEAEERERLKAENERLKQEQLEREKAEAERKAKEEAEAKVKAEEEHKAREKAKAKEAARRKAEQERLDAERKAREKAEAEARAIKEEQERKEKEKAERKAAEERAKAEAEEKVRRAPDKDKLQSLAVEIVSLSFPEVNSDIAKTALANVSTILNDASNYLKKTVAEM